MRPVDRFPAVGRGATCEGRGPSYRDRVRWDSQRTSVCLGALQPSVHRLDERSPGLRERGLVHHGGCGVPWGSLKAARLSASPAGPGAVPGGRGGSRGRPVRSPPACGSTTSRSGMLRQAAQGPPHIEASVHSQEELPTAFPSRAERDPHLHQEMPKINHEGGDNNQWPARLYPHGDGGEPGGADGGSFEGEAGIIASRARDRGIGRCTRGTVAVWPGRSGGRGRRTDAWPAPKPPGAGTGTWLLRSRPDPPCAPAPGDW